MDGLDVESGEKGSLHIVFASGLSKMAASITTYPHEVSLNKNDV
jgi:hypothetical protein